MFISVIATVGTVISSSLVAYGFSRCKFKGRGLLFAAMLVSMMLPAQVLMIPQYLWYQKLGWVGTYLPLIVPYFFAIQGFFVYLILNFIDGIPKDLDEAARIDGCSYFGIYLRIILPIAIGGLISGIGSGMAIRFGGAMDGIEVLAVIFAKRLGITVGTFVMAYNLVLYIICGFVIHSWILPLYSIVTYGAALKTVDFIVEGLDRSKAATIVTVHPDEVCAALSEAFECGMTITEAKGYYSDSPKTVVYIVVNRFQVGKMKELVHENDRSAYISIAEIADVYGANTDKV